MSSSLIRRSLIKEGGCFKVSGHSMFPSLISGTVVDVEKVDLSSLCAGDIILTEVDQQFRLHRLLRPIEEFQFQTAGDLCRRADAYQSTDRIVGRLLMKSPNLLEKICRQITLWRFNL